MRKHAGLDALLRRMARQVPEKNGVGLWSRPNLAGAAMNRFVHRIVMSVLLVAALVLIWNVLGAR
jgi:hypothetical protein